MITLSEHQIVTIKNSRKQGMAFKKIAKSLNVSSSTVHKYSKSVILTEPQQHTLEEETHRKLKRFVSIYSTPKKIQIPKINEDFVFLLGHLFFDGSVCKVVKGQYKCNYTNASLELIQEFVEKVKMCFGIQPLKIQTFDGVNVDWYQATFFSKKAHAFLLSVAPTFSTKEGARVPEFIFSLNEKLIGIFLQTFWDDEGSVSDHCNVTGCSKSEQMIDDLITLHTLLGIKSTKSRKGNGCFQIRIRSHLLNILIFSAKVNFSKAIVTKGNHIGRYKKDVLQDGINQKIACKL